MNQKQTLKLIPIMQAFVDGRTIEVRVANQWKPALNPQWHFDSEYRIKPEAREFMIEDTTGLYVRRTSIEGYKRHKINDSLENWIKVREVIE